MKHSIYRVESFKQTGDHTLEIRFNDGSSQRIDFEPMLEGELFGPLQLLLSRGGDVHMTDSHGQGALEHALCCQD